MNSFDEDFLKQNGLTNWFRIGDSELSKDIITGMPSEKGVYAVVSSQLPNQDFHVKGTGGLFKGRNPNVSKACLQNKWVNEAHILYIGKAGSADGNGRISKATLRGRINAYLKFGLGYNTSHWGGRYIWQLENSKDLLIYWRACNDGENPATLEKELILKFKEHYHKLPFANLTL
jgi:hypothetical protein